MPRERIHMPGESIGAFKVVRLLGSGALGAVYEAIPDPVEREDFIRLGIARVALKVARLEVLDREPEARRQRVERLYREYRTLLELVEPGQPNLPGVYEFGWHQGVPFLAMELVEGTSLEDVLALQPPMKSMLEVFRKLCAAVAVLHGRGIVHRDLKPSNVLLHGEEPVLVDFSHCLPPSGYRLTGADELVGTTLYASPQAEASTLEPLRARPYLGTSRDDVWALGVVLYEILTGDVPWQTPPQRREALVREMLRGPPLHPSEVNPEVPRTLGEVALAMLDPVPERRPRDAQAVLELLEPVLRESSVNGHVPERPWPRMPPEATGSEEERQVVVERHTGWGRGEKALVVAIAVLFVLGAGVIGWRGLVAVRLILPGSTSASAKADGAKAALPAALPVPSEPLPGQMRAPCPKQYVETSGACWVEIPLVTLPDGRHVCPEANDLLRELKGEDGRLRCLAAVMTHKKPSNVEEPVKRMP